MSDAHLLTDLQFSIMRVLWDRGSGSAAEICEALRPERGLAQSTVATLLTRLEKRGVVTHETRSRQYVYHPTVTEPEVRRTMVSDLTERLFDGDVAALMSHLLTARDISDGDLARVRQMIEAHEAGSGDAA
ncbi:MAG TPA: BlaI/MecI/CopY family transcriptional regulator [Gemmatimonadales bacterium]|nr:BlaI/MecI/CopY family transcriptional regulator [Gemmatimonadales bacterium]